MIIKIFQMIQDDLKKVEGTIRSHFADEKSDYSHSLEHTLRVKQLSEKIHTKEGGDLEVILMAALLHDVARYQEELGKCVDHAQEGAKISKKILENLGWVDSKINEVVHAVMVHSHNAILTKNDLPRTKEAKILMDADKLDSLGAVSILRAVASSLQTKQYGRPIHVPKINIDNANSDKPISAIHFLMSLTRFAKRPDHFYTTTARIMAKSRIKTMEDFINRFLDEYEIK